MLLFCFALFLLYLIPFMIFVKWTVRKLKMSRLLPLIAFFTGWFIPGWIAGQLNHVFELLFRNMGFSGSALEWAEAVQTAVWFLILIGEQAKKDYLTTGMSAGMGFQISEDLGYIEEQVGGSHRDFMNAIPFTIDSRIETSMESHWIYTAIMALGAYYFFYEKDRKKGILFMLVALADHGLWDAPVSGNMGAQALPGAVLLFVFFIECVKIMQTDAADMVKQA